MNHLFYKLAATAALLAGAAAAHAQVYPSQAIRLVIGFPPGGAIDTLARQIAPKMSADLGQPVLVENRAGAGGVIGMQSVARATPDGHTIVMGTMGNFSITPALVKDLPYNVQKDFAPVTQVATASFVLFANPTLPVTTVEELISYAKANPDKVNYSSSGNGGLPHMAGEMFNAAAGTKLKHIPYKGSAPSINDLVGGQVQLTFEALAIGLPQVQAKRLKALATTGTQRLSSLPEVPTISETVRGFSVKNWFGIAAPSGTPPERIARLQKSVADALRQPDVAAALTSLGVDAVGDTPAQFGAYIRSETDRWQDLITRNGIKAD